MQAKKIAGCKIQKCEIENVRCELEKDESARHVTIKYVRSVQRFFFFIRFLFHQGNQLPPLTRLQKFSTTTSAVAKNEHENLNLRTFQVLTTCLDVAA